MQRQRVQISAFNFATYTVRLLHYLIYLASSGLTLPNSLVCVEPIVGNLEDTISRDAVYVYIVQLRWFEFVHKIYVLEQNKKLNVFPCKPKFYYIKDVFQRV